MHPLNKTSLTVQYLVVELSVFVAQTAVICLVIWLLSNQMSSADGFNSVLMAKLESASVKEMMLTLVALVFVFGVVAIAQYFIEEGTIHDISNSVMEEFPRTIYFFGANLTSASLMAGLFVLSHPSTGDPSAFVFFRYAAFFAIVFFPAGCSLRYALHKKKGRRTRSSAEDIQALVNQ